MAEKRVTQGRMEPIRRPVRIGFLVPPGNPTVEVEMIALAPPNVSVHFTRMVAHGAVEEKLHELAEAVEQVMVVTAVEDEKKGERLVVLHTLSDEQLAALLQRLGECDLPALWKPRANQFFRVDALPYLGTGKLDLVEVRAIAQQRSQENEPRNVAAAN